MYSPSPVPKGSSSFGSLALVVKNGSKRRGMSAAGVADFYVYDPVLLPRVDPQLLFISGVHGVQGIAQQVADRL